MSKPTVKKLLILLIVVVAAYYAYDVFLHLFYGFGGRG